MLQYFCAIFEVLLSALLTVLLTEPRFTFEIHSCGVSSLSDFYTYFFNPSPNYEKTLICTQERVYPLQTMVLVFYASCVIFMLIFRPLVMSNGPANEKTSLYYALYAFPLLFLIYSIGGGFIYYSFAYISIIISCGMNAGHFAMKQDMDMKKLLVSSCGMRNLIIIGELTMKELEGFLIQIFLQLEIGSFFHSVSLPFKNTTSSSWLRFHPSFTFSPQNTQILIIIRF